jgi:large conductance mechanosensitive channel
MRGNVVDMAVGIIVGGAFGTIAKSLVNDVLMPPIGLLVGGVDFSDFFIVLKKGVPPGSYESLGQAQAAGAVTLNYGLFVNSVITFLIVAFAVFLLVKSINRLRREEDEKPEAATKDCAYCFSVIPARATRCPKCTSDLTEIS